MLGVGDRLPDFTVNAAKPGANEPTDGAVAALTQASFPGKWLLIYFYPKDFTFVCPTEIVEYAKLVPEFEDRDCVVLGGSTDNEFVKLAWRRAHPDLTGLNHWSFGDPAGALIDALGIRDREAGVALRATYLVDPNGVIQHVEVNALNVGRNPKETLRVLDALQTDELCACNRPVGGDTLKAA